jgi:hypothetical protein
MRYLSAVYRLRWWTGRLRETGGGSKAGVLINEGNEAEVVHCLARLYWSLEVA